MCATLITSPEQKHEHWMKQVSKHLFHFVDKLDGFFSTDYEKKTVC